MELGWVVLEAVRRCWGDKPAFCAESLVIILNSVLAERLWSFHVASGSEAIAEM